VTPRVLLAAMAALVFAGESAALDRPFTLGAGTHFGQNRGDPQRLVAALAQNGFASFRDEIFWHDVERQRGAYRLPPADSRVMRAIADARARGIDPLLILCYGNAGLYGEAYPVSEGAQDAFARYAEFMARALKGSVRHLEVWNEWNAGLGTSDGAVAKTPEHYFGLLRRTHAAIKRGNPDAVVVGGSVEGGGIAALNWIDRLLSLGGAKHMDALSVHPYLHHAGPDANPERLAGWFERLDEILRRHGAQDLPVLVTEIGWPMYRGPLGLTEERAADYAARTVLVLRTLRSVRGVWWYELQNSGADPNALEHNFGLLTGDFRVKPALPALTRVADALTDARVTRLAAAAPVWAVRLDRLDGRTTLAVWSTSPSVSTVELAVTVEGDVHVTIDAPGSAASTQRVRSGAALLPLRVSGTPTWIQLPTEAIRATSVNVRGSDAR
jgi:hypothetical protein